MREVSPKREAFMSEADQFRHYAREAARSSSQATSENEKQVLMGLACTWAQAALMSDRVLGSSFIPSPRNPHDGASVADGPDQCCHL